MSSPALHRRATRAQCDRTSSRDEPRLTHADRYMEDLVLTGWEDDIDQRRAQCLDSDSDHLKSDFRHHRSSSITFPGEETSTQDGENQILKATGLDNRPNDEPVPQERSAHRRPYSAGPDRRPSTRNVLQTQPPSSERRRQESEAAARSKGSSPTSPMLQAPVYSGVFRRVGPSVGATGQPLATGRARPASAGGVCERCARDSGNYTRVHSERMCAISKGRNERRGLPVRRPTSRKVECQWNRGAAPGDDGKYMTPRACNGSRNKMRAAPGDFPAGLNSKGRKKRSTPFVLRKSPSEEDVRFMPLRALENGSQLACVRVRDPPTAAAVRAARAEGLVRERSGKSLENLWSPSSTLSAWEAPVPKHVAVKIIARRKRKLRRRPATASTVLREKLKRGKNDDKLDAHDSICSGQRGELDLKRGRGR